MPGINISLINLKGLSKPITKLVESVSKGVGKIYEPIGTVLQAHADAKAISILTQGQCNANDIVSRANERISFKEIRRQENIDEIVVGAAEYLPETVTPTPVDEDWIINFFELCQDISNSEMQKIWSKILAGEVATPGTFAPRTLHTVKNLTPEEAHMFTALCSFSFKNMGDDFIFPILSHSFYEFIRNNNLSTTAEIHLKNIGLLSGEQIFFNDSSDLHDFSNSKVTLDYFSEKYAVTEECLETQTNTLAAFPFTKIGNELASIAGSKRNEEFIQCLIRNKVLMPLKTTNRSNDSAI